MLGRKRNTKFWTNCRQPLDGLPVSVSKHNLRKTPSPQVVTVIAPYEDCRDPDSAPRHSREVRRGIPGRGPSYVSRQARARLLPSCRANEQRDESGILQRQERYLGPDQTPRLLLSRPGSEHLDSLPEAFVRHPLHAQANSCW